VTSITENHVVSALAAERRLLPLVSASATLFIAVMGNLELAIAKSADADRWDCSKPFE
jgi:hypothetical protein